MVRLANVVQVVQDKSGFGSHIPEPYIEHAVLAKY
jgi:hypothetical protein